MDGDKTMQQNSVHAQRGAFIIEAAVTFTIICVCMMLLVNDVPRNADQSRYVQSRATINVAAKALEEFARVHGRLPCPAPDTAGIEDCDSSTADYLPYLSIGLADEMYAGLKFNLNRESPELHKGDFYKIPWSTPDGGATGMQPTMQLLSSIATADPIFNLCWGMASAPATGLKLAYSISGSESMNGGNSAPNPAHESQLNVSRGELSARLSCSKLAIPGRAHFDALVAARTMRRGGADNLKIFDVGIPLAYIDLAQGVYYQFNADYGTVKAANKFRAAESKYAASGYADARKLNDMRMAAAQAPLYALHAESLATQVVRWTIVLVRTINYKRRFEALQTKVQDTESLIERNALASAKPVFQKNRSPTQNIERLDFEEK